jgi:hypothetical protein
MKMSAPSSTPPAEGALDQLSASSPRFSAALKDISAQLTAALSSSDTLAQLSQLTAGLQQFSSQYGDFHNGLMLFTAGVTELSNNYGALHTGLTALPPAPPTSPTASAKPPTAYPS